MEEKDKREPARMIHVRLPEKIHKRLRVKTAEEDTTIQEWVAQLIQKHLDSSNK